MAGQGIRYRKMARSLVGLLMLGLLLAQSAWAEIIRLDGNDCDIPGFEGEISVESIFPPIPVVQNPEPGLSGIGNIEITTTDGKHIVTVFDDGFYSLDTTGLNDVLRVSGIIDPFLDVSLNFPSGSFGPDFLEGLVDGSANIPVDQFNEGFYFIASGGEQCTGPVIDVRAKNGDPDDPVGRIIIDKQVIGEAEDDWRFKVGRDVQIEDFTLPAAGGVQPLDLPPGTYKITELANLLSPFLKIEAVCTLEQVGTGGGDVGTVVATGMVEEVSKQEEDIFQEAEVLVQVTDGDIIRCTFTNTFAGNLEVRKVVEGTPPDFGWDFTITEQVGTEQFESEVNNVEEGLVFQPPSIFSPTTYTITEKDTRGFFATVDCVLFDSDGISFFPPRATGTDSVTVNVGPGEHVKCFFTNTAPGRITIEKEVVGGIPASDWEFTGDLDNFSLPAAGGGLSFPDLVSGMYTITEADTPGFTPSVECFLLDMQGNKGLIPVAEGEASVTVDLKPGQHVTCTFTNTTMGDDDDLDDLDDLDSEPPVNICGGVAFFADEDIDLARGAFTQGSMHANDSIEFKIYSEHTGAVSAVDEIVIRKNATIFGFVNASDVTNEGIASVVVEGPVDQRVGPPIPNFEPGTDEVWVRNEQTLDLPPGQYEDIRVGRDATLNLTAGDYFVEKMTIQLRGAVNVDTTGGEVRIFVEDDFTIKRDGKFDAQGGLLRTTNVTIYAEDFRIGRNGVFNGGTVIVDEDARLKNGSFFRGNICAGEDINIGTNVTMVDHESDAVIP